MVGIGFFAPLPLAIMMPFMAGQSMMMGEAFGKSYQYGKRKISAMSNEEFNKLTMDDLARQLSTDYSQIIPHLAKSVQQSHDFQSFIIQELASIIRSLPKDIISGVSGDPQAGQDTLDFLKSLLNPLPKAYGSDTKDEPLTTENLIDSSDFGNTSKYNQAIFRAMPLNELIKGINSGRFTGSDLSLAKHVLKQRQTTDETLIPTPEQPKDTVFIAWQNKLFNAEKEFLRWKKAHIRNPSGSGGNRNYYLNRARGFASEIRSMSNDYRSPNDGIRREAINLRQRIANGMLKI